MIDIIPIQCDQHYELIVYVGTDERPPSLENIRDVILRFGTAASAMSFSSSSVPLIHVASCRSRLCFSGSSMDLQAVETTPETLVEDVRAVLQEPGVMVVVRVGDEDRPASSLDIEHVADVLSSSPPTSDVVRVLITHHAIRIASCGGN